MRVIRIYGRESVTCVDTSHAHAQTYAHVHCT